MTTDVGAPRFTAAANIGGLWFVICNECRAVIAATADDDQRLHLEWHRTLCPKS